MAKGICVFAEQSQGKLRKVSRELLGQGKVLADRLGEPLIGIVLGYEIEGFALEVAAYGVDKVILADAPQLKEYTTGAYTSVLHQIIRQEDPTTVWIGNTSVGKDLAPRLAQRLDVGCISDCIEADMDAKASLVFKRPIYAGKAFAEVSAAKSPVVATIRPNAFPAAQPGSSRHAEVEMFPVQVGEDDLRAIVKEVITAVTKRPELTEAQVIVSGGRGLKGPENFKMLEDLADVMGAAVGASRAVVDAGWREAEFQVGQTGKTVSPTLYIACGISGAIQHLAGMSSSRYIVAINTDPEANIFKVADAGIVGDLFEAVPLLTQELREIVQ